MILDKICVYICICNIVLLHSITSKFTQTSVASEYFIRVRRYTTIIHLTPFRTRNQTRDLKKVFRVVEPEELQFPDTMLRFSLCTRGMQREILL